MEANQLRELSGPRLHAWGDNPPHRGYSATRCAIATQRTCCDSNATWYALAGLYPNASHIAVTKLLAAASQRARRLHFREGPLAWSAPRPDSSANGFCLSCHEAGSQVSKQLSPAALSLDSKTLLPGGRRAVARAAHFVGSTYGMRSR